MRTQQETLCAHIDTVRRRGSAVALTTTAGAGAAAPTGRPHRRTDGDHDRAGLSRPADPHLVDDGGERAVNDNIYEAPLARTADGADSRPAAELPTQVDDTARGVAAQGISFVNGDLSTPLGRGHDRAMVGLTPPVH